MANTMDKPAIFIAVPTAASDLPATLKPLLNGIEEEAIPVQTKVIAEDRYDYCCLDDFGYYDLPDVVHLA